MKKGKAFLKINFLLIFFLLFLFFLKPVFAVNDSGGDTASTNPYQTFQQSLNSPEMNLNKWIGGDMGVLEATSLGLTRMIIGDISASPSDQTSYQPSGAIGGVAGLISAMYAHPPASSVEYFADLGKNLGIVKPAYAQTGVGFRGLAPILPLWKVFRNIAYLFFTIIFVVIGFAIMFRVKLNPQTVISIQNAIPRIVVALILVTFSYAIAGLLIDLIYVFISLAISIIGQGLGADIITKEKIIEEQKTFMNLTFSHGWSVLTWRGLETYWTDIFPGMLQSAWGSGWLFSLIGIILAFLGGGAGGLLFSLILLIIVLYVMIKLFISLLKSYISIILSVIFGPLQITLGILPGNQGGFGAWLRNILANAMVFPAVAIFIFFSWYLGKLISHSISETQIWTPPGLSGSSQLAIGLISLGMILIVHKIPDIIKEALQVKPFPYGAAIGEVLGPLKPIVGVPVGWGKWEAGTRLEKTWPNWSGLPREIGKGVAGWLKAMDWYK